MHQLTVLYTPGILQALDLEGVHSVADLGGGTGTLLISLLQQHPQQLRGTLVEMPSVCEEVQVPSELRERVTLQPGNFFEASGGQGERTTLFCMVVERLKDGG